MELKIPYDKWINEMQEFCKSRDWCRKKNEKGEIESCPQWDEKAPECCRVLDLYNRIFHTYKIFCLRKEREERKKQKAEQELSEFLETFKGKEKK